jgi:hypothetical protein
MTFKFLRCYYLKNVNVLTIEMTLAESDFVILVFIKGRGVEIFNKLAIMNAIDNCGPKNPNTNQ